MVIDLQNDYFSDAKFSLGNTQATLQKVVKAIEEANAQRIPVVLIEMPHNIALHVLSTRIPLVSSMEALG